MFEAPPEEPVMKVAIVGRRNTGKSTFVNTLAKAERMIVSEVPGTTRDSVDVRFELDGKTFIAIDTAGVRRHKSIRTDIDFYSFHRAQRSIRRADVVLLFFDCTQRLSKVDKQLCKYIADQYKPCIFVVNKWDLLYGQMPTERWVDYLRDTFPTMWHVPIAFITGQTGKNVKALLNHAQMLFKQSLERVTHGAARTGWCGRRWKSTRRRMHGILRPKIFYATQVGVQPPTIVLICNEPKAFHGHVPAVSAAACCATTSTSAKCRSRCTCRSAAATTSATSIGAGEDSRGRGGPRSKTSWSRTIRSWSMTVQDESWRAVPR